MSQDINRVTVTGRLTRDPELQALPSGKSLCKFGIAVNEPKKLADGEWTDYANFFNVTVFGRQGENCADFLRKGRQVSIDGRLHFSSWNDNQSGTKSKVEIIAERVVFLSPPRESQQSAAASPAASTAGLDVPEEDFDSDIPF